MARQEAIEDTQWPVFILRSSKWLAGQPPYHPVASQWARSHWTVDHQDSDRFLSSRNAKNVRTCVRDRDGSAA